MTSLAVDPSRTLAELRELDALTGGSDGARRVAWTDTWARARSWLRERLEVLPVEIEVDAAGNLWATLPGASKRTLGVGSHLDSVPQGGWLDGALGVLAALEVLRGFAAAGPPPVNVRLVDFADEEGARFGRSVFGSSAAAGTLELDGLHALRDSDGIAFTDALASYGVTLEGLAGLCPLRDLDAFLELHIEQGPVLERRNVALGAVTGALGVERHAVSFAGQSAHAGSTPMEARRDPLAAAARLLLEVRAAALDVGGVGTVGRIEVIPGAVTVIPAGARVHIDQRHQDACALQVMLERVTAASREIAAEEHVDVVWEKLLAIPPMSFDPQLVELAAAAVSARTGVAVRLPSGPLHDAVEVARAGTPAAMLFVQSLGGLSHTRNEDTHPDHIESAVCALADLAERVSVRLAHKDPI